MTKEEKIIEFVSIFKHYDDEKSGKKQYIVRDNTTRIKKMLIGATHIRIRRGYTKTSFTEKITHMLYWKDVIIISWNKALSEKEKDIKIILDNLKSERFHVKERGERIEMLEKQISKLQAELKESKKRDVWYMKPSDIDEVIQRNRHRVISYEELDKLQAEIQEIRRIITENVADEGLEALLQIKINELKKGSDV